MIIIFFLTIIFKSIFVICLYFKSCLTFFELILNFYENKEDGFDSIISNKKNITETQNDDELPKKTKRKLRNRASKRGKRYEEFSEDYDSE